MEESSQVVGADFIFVSLDVKVLSVNFRIGLFSRRVVIWVSMAASSVGDAESEGSYHAR